MSDELDSGRYTTAYSSDGEAILGGRFNRFNNRPIYANNRDDVILGGDRPVIRFGRNPFLFGSLVVAVRRSSTRIWLHEADDVQMAYRSGRLSWLVKDSALSGLLVILEVVPTIGCSGMVVRLRSEGAKSGDHIFWCFGGAISGINPNAAFDAAVSESVRTRGFLPEDSIGNVVEIHGDRFSVTAPETEFPVGSGKTLVGRTIGRCSEHSSLSVGDANAPDEGSGYTSGKRPTLLGETSLSDMPIFWGFLGHVDGATSTSPLLDELDVLFEQGWERGKQLADRCVIVSPDLRLNALASASVAAIDGTWYPPCFVHSAMLWNIPFPGWRTIFGGTMFGWHDRVRETARYFISSQVLRSDKREAEADPRQLLTMQSENSRFHGKGRLTAHAGLYDMQSQFFDQLITEWRWTADPEFEKLLRPALDLHLEWMQECFDPEKSGVYESYINSWPTDSVWYDGGGSCEATSYAYRGHRAAWEMAGRAGDSEAESFHREVLERIKSGFFRELWISRRGHPGKYREQGGRGRLHENPWLYGIFLPVDSGLLTPTEMATTLNYVRSSLQNDVKPSGGRMVWNSNWVPAIWSTRTDWPGDNFALALAYFQAGFAEDGWEVFRGTFLTGAFDLACPGNLGHRAGGYDFGDCSHPFTRTLVEGLFGYNPDYPNGRVRLRPQLPVEWDATSFQIPDFSCSLFQSNGRLQYVVRLASAACMDISLPVRAGRVDAVLVDDEPTPYELCAGIDTAVVKVSLCRRSEAKIDITFVRVDVPSLLTSREVTTGEKCSICFERAEIRSVRDMQGIFCASQIIGGSFQGVVSDNVGSHLLLVEVAVGKTTWIRPVYLDVKPANAIDERKIQLIVTAAPDVRWHTIDLSAILNCDVRSIFRQEYLSPRPNTVSVRLGTDGWTPWTSTFWKQSPPLISLEHIPELLNSEGWITTPQGAHFAWPADGRNIAFTTLWDNFPSSVSVPVKAEGESIWLLIAGSTNPMQCEIANAIVRLHFGDGTSRCLELIPPKNFWALAPLCISGPDAGQEGRHDYIDPVDSFCVPKPYPTQVQLGTNCRAMVYGLVIPSGKFLDSISLETLSKEVVIGLMGVTLCRNP